MNRKRITYTDVETLRSRFEERKDAIRQRLVDFSRVPPEEYFYELVYCILTPQSSAVNAAKAVENLKAAGFIRNETDPAPVLRQKSHYIRFHNTKSRHLREVKVKYPAIALKLRNGTPPRELRAWLVSNVKGLGWKEASHFLRNIGYRDLAILDRHILRNLKSHNVVRSIPKVLTPKRYGDIETRFAFFARTLGITMDELDLLFWSNETGEILK
jgi:N-glycosylase/DNA lyase